MKLENSSVGMPPELVDEGELFAAPRAVEERYAKGVRLSEQMVEHGSKRCDSSAACNEQDSLVRDERREREGAKRSFEVHGGARYSRTEVRAQTSVLFDCNEQVEQSGLLGLTR